MGEEVGDQTGEQAREGVHFGEGNASTTPLGLLPGSSGGGAARCSHARRSALRSHACLRTLAAAPRTESEKKQQQRSHRGCECARRHSQKRDKERRKEETSMWRGRVMYFSTRTRSSLKEAMASRRAPSRESANSSGVRTMRIPLPPPPSTALIRTG